MNWKMVLTKEFISVFGFIILFLFVKTNNKMRRGDKKLFYCVIITGIAELIAFEAELWTASFAEPSFFRVLLSVIGYTLRPFLVFILILLSDRSRITVKKKILLLSPCVICFFCVSTAFFSKIAFWYDSSNQFHRGVFGYFPHIICGIYFLVYAYVSCKYARRHSLLDGIMATAISIFAITALFIDTFVSAGGTTRIAIMLCTFYAYVQCQNHALFSMIEDLRVKNDEITLLMNQIGKTVCIYDVPTKTLTMTEEYAKLRGFSSKTAIVPDETCSNHLVCDESEGQYIEFYNKIFAGEHNGSIIAKFIMPYGGERWEKTDFVNILDENGQAKRAIISIEDITKEYEEKLLLEKYRNTLDGLMGDNRYCVLYDITEHKIIASEGDLLSFTEDFKDKTLENITDYLVGNFVKESDAEVVREFMSHDNIVSSYNSGIMNRHIERVAVLPNGDERWFRLDINIDSVNNKNNLATLILEDIDNEYRMHNDLITRANFDILTGTMTRDATMHEIDSYLKSEGKNGTHALIMMDMDNLKQINDHFGHQTGDLALQNFANEIKQFFREEDIIGRIGGDEFFVFVKNITGIDLYEKLYELLRNLECLYPDGKCQIAITASIGISMYHGDALPVKSVKDLYAESDAALYKSKALGKNIFTFSDELDVLSVGTSDSLLKNDLFSYSLKGLLDNLANGIAIFHGTAHGEVKPMLCNKKLPMLLGIDHNQFNTHLSAENGYGIHPDDFEEARQILYEAIQSGGSVRKIFRMLRGDGEYCYVTVFANAHCVEDGNFDLYCIFSNAEEVEQLRRIRELRYRNLEKKLMQVADKNEAYCLLNITQNTCVDRYQTHTLRHDIGEHQIAEDVLTEIANDIAIEEYRKDFCDKFSMDKFYKDVKEGVVSKEIRVPFLREGRSAQWYQLNSELSFDPNTGDIEVFIVFTDIDNEVRLEYVIDRLLDDEYEYMCQIDVQSGCIARVGESYEDGLSKEDNGKILYNDILPFGVKKLLPEEYQESGLEALGLEQIISELCDKAKYNVIFPVTNHDGREERLCQWCFEYMDATRNTILMCRKNISGFLDYGYDSLTGLLGRKGFYKEIRRVLLENPNEKYFLAEIDFDNFRLVNEKYGYSEGNRFIRQFGADMRKQLNTKGKGCYVSHFEGDCFVVLCSTEAISRPEDLYEDIAAQMNAYPDMFRLKLRMGVCEIKDTAVDTELMCDCAHLALSACKGRFDRYINYYTDDLKDRMLDEQLLASEMQNAINTEQFEIWFQPQVNHANNGQSIGAEALVRWNHPTRGLIYPGVFIPLFEQNGFVYELDKYVWRNACRYIRHWMDEGIKPLPISVNVSRLDILHVDFLETIVSLVEEYGIPYELIHLEITESAFSSNAEKVVENVRELINRGFTVAIDDFGSGYSALSMLKDVPAHILKLDMRFFDSEKDATRNECIIESVIRMAKRLGMSVLAEGVEHMEQADMLHTVGCDYIQGYFYSKPLPYDDYMEYVKKSLD